MDKLQAVFRGNKSRSIHAARARAGFEIICPFYGCSESIVEEMVRIGEISRNDILFDLGSGTGNIINFVAKQTGAMCFGFDIDQSLCITSARRSRELGVVDQVDVVIMDIATIDISLASIICLFLVPSCLKVLSGTLSRHFNDGGRIVCYKFPLPESLGWRPYATKLVEDVINIRSGHSFSLIYYYKKLE